MKILLCLAALVAITAAKSCLSDGDCLAEECCLEPLFGKRFIFKNLKGTCTALSVEGASCEPPTFRDPFNPRLHEWHCPCVSGYECHGEKEVHENGSHSYTNPKCKVSNGSTTIPTPTNLQ